MIKIQTFIVIHDQDILLDSIKYHKYDSIDNFIFLFVGSGDVSKVKERKDVIICRDLEHNIEQYKNLTSYTAWYAVWKNNLCDETIDYVTFLEYDCLLHKDYFRKLKTILKKKQDIDIVGYSQINVHDPLFVGNDGGRFCLKLNEALEKIYNIDIQKYIQKYPLNKKCSVVLNKTIRKNIFNNYMEWSTSIVNEFMILENAGHFVERLITVYYLLNNLNHIFLSSAVINLEFNQHNYAMNEANRFDLYEYIIGKNTSNIDIDRSGDKTYIIGKK